MHLLRHLRLTHRGSDDADSTEAEPTITLGRGTQWTELLLQLWVAFPPNNSVAPHSLLWVAFPPNNSVAHSGATLAVP